MRALDRKISRDLWKLRGQVLAISLVIASGVAVLIMSLSTLESLQQTTQAYYERYRFGDVFVNLKRAPENVANRIAAIPGVQLAETRITRYATIDMASFAEPVMGQFVSLPDNGQPILNQLALQSGRWLDAGGDGEVIMSEPFAQAHNLDIGDTFTAILNGKRRKLTIAGTALCPEFIYSLGPGALMADDKRFGIVWMQRSELAAMFDLKGAFNQVTLDLTPDASPDPIIQRLDELLERYGGVGAVARADQLSNWFIMNELEQMRTMSKILPSIFLLIAAFLTNMVMNRLIATERSEIGLMKAFGYSNWEVGLHYAKLVSGIVLFGVLVGSIVGGWLGRMNTEIYADLFRFPLLLYQNSSRAIIISGSLSLIVAMAGASGALRRVINLPPAEAMQPPAPAKFKRSFLLQTALGRWLDQPSRIIVRNILRWPVRAMLSCLGVACAVGLLIMSLQWKDSLDYLAESFFFDAQHQHITIGLSEASGANVMHNIEHLPGVMRAEPMRFVGADFSAGHLTHRGVLNAIDDGNTLQPMFDDERKIALALPPDSIVIDRYLARKLNVGIGDTVWIRTLSGRRPELPLTVADLIVGFIGMSAYIHIDTINRALKEPDRVEFANLFIDQAYENDLYEKLKSTPSISSVMVRRAAIDSFYGTVVNNLMVFITIFTALSCVMSFGVTYNSARITLSERGRELATLRVLGFSRGEISYILLGEVALIVCLALPLGCFLGKLLSQVMISGFNTELFRIPLTINPSTYGTAALITLGATFASAVVVKRRVVRLNLIEVLKTRE